MHCVFGLLQLFCVVGALLVIVPVHQAAPLEPVTDVLDNHCECHDRGKAIDCSDLIQDGADTSYLRIQIVCHNLRSAEPLRALYGRLRSAAPNSPIVVTINGLAMKALPARFFDGISTHIMHLNTSNVSEFDDDVFRGFETKVLDMKTNTPVAPPLGAIKEIPKLGSLMLHGYKVAVVKKGSFSDDLTTLGLSSCGVHRFEEDALPRGLVLLNLNSNHDLRPEGLQNVFRKLAKLRSLMLKETAVTIFNKDLFMGLKNLISLFLVDCNIKQLDDDVFSTLPKLDQLYLGKNALKEFRFILSTNVSNLNLDDNNLTALDEELFKELAGRRLRSLNLNDNGFSDVPTALQHLSQLGSLSLSGNHISKLNWSAFDGMRKLRSLNLEHNELILIEGQPELPELWSLDLMGNLLESLHGSLKSLHLGSLNLAANRIEKLPLEELPVTLRSIKLEGNPIHCDNHSDGDFDRELFEKIAILVKSNHGAPYRDCVRFAY
ncbi:insulin-like growth factor-binding protein complex acid labile subunit [Galendromus occidentalis]|uniref:Insulin-like growth factor-binding protein complex acid labile subunit n=1 Tax=Galendromus occidentalis TaxID=34638 RepID=A0AAJ6VY18_9ACAR|nr:insulin-like growth factor-binding protein complex acid labile subunit [Galendromus occidentalis]